MFKQFVCRTMLLVLCLAFPAVFHCEPALCDDARTRRPLEHKDYDLWNTLSGYQLSRDGQWVAYSILNGSAGAQAELRLRNLKTGGEYAIARGSSVQFTFDSQLAIYRVLPDAELVKQLRKRKRPSSEFPKTELKILNLKDGDVTTLAGIASFRLPEESSNWLACQLESSGDAGELKQNKSAPEIYEVTEHGLVRPEKPLKLKSREQLRNERGETKLTIREKSASEEPKKATESKKAKNAKDSDDRDKNTRDGRPLVLINLETGIRRTFPGVTSFVFSKHGERLAFATLHTEQEETDSSGAKDNHTASKRGDGVHVIDLTTLKKSSVAGGEGQYRGLTFSDDGKHLAFMTTRDDADADSPSWAVYHWKTPAKSASKIADEKSAGIPVGWWISPRSSQRFSEDGRRLFFDTAPIPDDVLDQRKAKKDGKEIAEKDDSDQAKLDIWHWQDPQLQPQQLLQVSLEKNRDYRATYNLKRKKIVQLATRDVPSMFIDYRSSNDIAVANTNVRYLKTLSWDMPGYQDVYLVDLDSGKRELALEKVKWRASLSPAGKYMTWFDAEKGAWFAKATKPDSEVVEISAGIEHPLYDELHDTPNLPRPYGSAGWMMEDEAFLVYDSYDIWKLDPTGTSEPECITSGFGRSKDLSFRYRTLDPLERAIAPDASLMLSAFNRKTKASGYYILNLARPSAPSDSEDAEDASDSVPPLQRLVMLDEAMGRLVKAKDSDRVVFTRSTFRNCPDLWASTIEFEEIQRVSDINPHQDRYTWGTAELVHWDASDGQPLDGILLKPDDFDPSKKYPMMVYFYERNSDNLHSYYPPAAGRSIICHSFYVSRGYLVFIPDIPYKTGEPGPSAANAILPGVESLVAQGFVDSNKIGMQGHSWGGYQTAYLVTQTDMFACAESGAPVSNMTSAYGGIRWGSGMSRMFQYERTQSRIGEDLWSAREKYIANSPLFFADKINTPLLILHNDEDGAVPWYQGIELFVALRRLEKPAWMLNYNGNPHWVMGDANRRDFAIRMQQFFDYYLMDAPEPEWMAVGVRAVDKGENYGLELLEPESED
ncbi:MAG TPA: S9 family peptidase [Planctomycetaceae bacterium]|nr:S9 family peptidase [Planctomycetaceae bacterium]